MTEKMVQTNFSTPKTYFSEPLKSLNHATNPIRLRRWNQLGDVEPPESRLLAAALLALRLLSGQRLSLNIGEAGRGPL